MNRQHPSHNETDLDRRAAEVESRLSQLRPRPSAIDAESVWQAANPQPAQPVVLPPSVPNSHFRTIALSWGCGAIAGAVVTCLVLLPLSKPDTVIAAAENTTDLPPSELAASDPSNADVGPSRKQSSWSQNELRVSADLNQWRDPTGNRPLTAGNYLPLSSTAESISDRSLVGPTIRSGVKSSVMPTFQQTPPRRSVQSQQLLRELLGADPGKRF